MNNNDELLQIFNENGQVQEPLPRSLVHTKPVKYWHGVADVWLVNLEGKILVSKRSETVSGNPGKWQTYFGGHVPAGFTHLQTAVKELEEEIGLNVKPEDLQLIGEGKYSDENHLHFFKKYVTLYRNSINDLTFKDGEVVEVKWMDLDDYWSERNSNLDVWTNGCPPEYQEKIKSWLRTKLVS